MKVRSTRTKTWFSDLKDHVLGSMTWGRLIYIAVLFAATVLVYSLVREK